MSAPSMAAWIRRSPKMSRLLGGRRSPQLPHLGGDDGSSCSSSDGGASSCCGDSLDPDGHSECEYGPLVRSNAPCLPVPKAVPRRVQRSALACL